MHLSNKPIIFNPEREKELFLNQLLLVFQKINDDINDLGGKIETAANEEDRAPREVLAWYAKELDRLNQIFGKISRYFAKSEAGEVTPEETEEMKKIILDTAIETSGFKPTLVQ